MFGFFIHAQQLKFLFRILIVKILLDEYLPIVVEPITRMLNNGFSFDEICYVDGDEAATGCANDNL